MAVLLRRRFLLLMCVPVALLAAAVFAAASLERSSAILAGQRQHAAQAMLTAVLDQETGSRGYFQTDDPQFLEPWDSGAQSFSDAVAQARRLDAGDRALLAALATQERLAATWRAQVQQGIAALQAGGRRPSVATALRWKATVDSFRAVNDAYSAAILRQQSHDLTVATWSAAGLAGGLSLLLLGSAMLLMRRVRRDEDERERAQAELRDLLQVSESEQESRTLLISHIERTLPGAEAVVMNRNNSDDRLEPTCGERAPGGPLLALGTEQLVPRSCLAVRLSRPYERRAGEAHLVRCEVCGKVDAEVACEPLLVGGQVIGSVLVARDSTIRPEERQRVRASVVQAAPILSNQRNLALAETRAASDPLTGLANRRAAADTLKRMTAHASRSASPLAAVLLDLDHFKQINDKHGHEQGDEALAAVGQILSGVLRASDFAARYGGEEFLLLLPDTPRDAAAAVAEKLRAAIARADVGRIGTITASFGVAVMPDDAVEPEQLLRAADRALYTAKNRGRDRVELVAAAVV